MGQDEQLPPATAAREDNIGNLGQAISFGMSSDVRWCRSLRSFWLLNVVQEGEVKGWWKILGGVRVAGKTHL